MGGANCPPAIGCSDDKRRCKGIVIGPPAIGDGDDNDRCGIATIGPAPAAIGGKARAVTTGIAAISGVSPASTIASIATLPMAVIPAARPAMAAITATIAMPCTVTVTISVTPTILVRAAAFWLRAGIRRLARPLPAMVPIAGTAPVAMRLARRARILIAAALHSIFFDAGCLVKAALTTLAALPLE